MHIFIIIYVSSTFQMIKAMIDMSFTSTNNDNIERKKNFICFRFCVENECFDR